MNKTQFQAISYILSGDQSDEDKLQLINAALETDLSDRAKAKALKEKIIGNDTIEIEVTDGLTTVTFSDTGATASSFGLAFIATLLAVINDRALSGFLPEPKQPKTASAGKRDGLASPAPGRTLPVTGKNY